MTPKIFNPDFGIFHNVSDDSYHRGYAEGEAAGQQTGYEKGQQIGIEQGKQAEYDRFWDAYQQNGERTDYQFGFAGHGWTDETFKPKYPMKPTHIANGFRYSNITDLRGLDIDFSKITDFSFFLMGSKVKYIGTLDMTGAKTYQYVFEHPVILEEIDKVILRNDGLQISGAPRFSACSKLRQVRFEGVIMGDPVFSNASLLSNESVQSIIDHLKDLTGATTQNLTFHATVGAKLTDAQKAAITAKNWTLVY